VLLGLHAVAIEFIAHLQTTRDRTQERTTSLLLIDLPPAPAPPHPPAHAEPKPPRPLLAPLPPAEAAAPASLHDSATPLATADTATASSGTAASMPGPAKLDLTIPKDFYAHPPPLTPAQEALQDPRSNRLVLTRQEQMDIAFGVVECIAWQRMPDGSIYRGPGHRQRIQGLSTNPFTRHKPGEEDRPSECVQ
jgi:hypothetical protein